MQLPKSQSKYLFAEVLVPILPLLKPFRPPPAFSMMTPLTGISPILIALSEQMCPVLKPANYCNAHSESTLAICSRFDQIYTSPKLVANPKASQFS